MTGSMHKGLEGRVRSLGRQYTGSDAVAGIDSTLSNTGTHEGRYPGNEARYAG